jgi:hypothetical protein
MFKITLLLSVVLAREYYNRDREDYRERRGEDKFADDFEIGQGYFIDEDGVEREIPQTQSDGRYDHMGHIPDLGCPTNSYLWIQIPYWKVIESPIKTEPCDYKITCELVDSRGRITTKNCDTRLEIFIENRDEMTIYPLSGWTGQAQVTLQSVNFNGEHDFTVFNVVIVEADDENCSSASSLDGQYWT